MVKYPQISKRSPMYISIDSRMLGVAVTVFILILTFKSEILYKSMIITQLILAIPLLIGAMISHAKIVDVESFKQYYLFNRICNALALAFVVNTLGLLVANYVSFALGVSYFILIEGLLIGMIIIDFNKRKFYNEILMGIIVFIFGLLPSCGLFSL